MKREKLECRQLIENNWALSETISPKRPRSDTIVSQLGEGGMGDGRGYFISALRDAFPTITEFCS